MKSSIVFGVCLFVCFAGNSGLAKNLPENSQSLASVKLTELADKEVCEFCVGAFNHFKDVFSTYESQLKVALLNFCKITGSYQQECSALVNQYFDKLWNILVTNFNPKEFCTLITLCPGTSIYLDQIESLKKSAPGSACQVCTEFKTLAVRKLKKENVKNAIKSEALSVCLKYGLGDVACKTLVDQQFDSIYQELVKFVENEDLCGIMGLCPKSEKLGESETCTICKQVIGTIKYVVSQDAVKQSIKTELESICSATGSLEEECKLAVEFLFNEAFEYVLDFFNPYTLCEELKACPTSSAEAVALEKKVGDDKCKLCEEVFGTLKVALQQATVKTELKNELLSVCKDVGSFAPECKLVLNLVFDKAYDDLIKLVNPYTTCKELKFCSSVSLKITSQKEILSKPETSNYCLLCVESVDILKSVMNDTEFKSSVKKELQAICAETKSFSSQCTSYVNQYFDEFYELFVSQLDGDSICTFFGVCAGQKKKFGKEICEICETGVTALKEELSSQSTQDEIKKELLIVCSKLGSVSSSCKSYVSDYFGIVFPMALQYLTPGPICADAGLCSKSQKSEYPLLQAEETCSLCNVGAQMLVSELQTASVKATAKQAVTALCTYVTSAKTCQVYIDNYFDASYNFILMEYLTPKLICEDLKLCKSTSLQSASTSNDMICDICNTTLTELKIIMATPQIESDIKATAVKACSYAESYASECQKLVNQYFPVIYELLLQYLEPSATCADIGFCLKTTEPTTVSRNETVSFSACDVCKTMTSLFAEEIKEAESKGKVIALAEFLKLCTKLPGDISDQCTDFIKIYGPPVLQMTIEEYGNPAHICSELRIC